MTENILLELKHPSDPDAPNVFILLGTSECSQVTSTYNSLSDAEKRAGLSTSKATLPAGEHWEVDSTCAVKPGTTPTPTPDPDAGPPTPTPETAILRTVSTDLFQIDLGSADPTPTPTPDPQPTLGSPTGVYGVGITASECRVHFNLPSGATQLGIRRATTAGGPWTTVTAGTTGEATPNNDRAYVDGGLTANTRYYYQIRPLDDNGGFGSWMDVAGPSNGEIRTTN